MNTVGKPGKLGEGVRCVVSVSMLTEGWDANTVTHILGVRAFGTQLLCEQVVGRGLRRRSYVVGKDGRFEPEYAEVYGVPFSFIPASGGTADPKPGPIPTRVRALPDRIACEITFPRLVSYRWEIPDEHLEVEFIDESLLALDSKDVPTRTDVAAIVGETEEHRLDRFEAMRPQQVAFQLAKRLLDRYFRAPDAGSQPGAERPWLFPRLVDITKRWITECVTLKDDAFIGLLAMAQRADDAVERVYLSIVRYQGGERRLVPLLRPYEPVGSSRHVDFDTTKDVYVTHPDRCHVSHVACDSGWEGMSREEIDAAVARHSENEILVDQPYEDRRKVRVTGRFTVESLSPHRVLDGERPPPSATETAGAGDAESPTFEQTILDNLRKAGVHNTFKGEAITFDRLDLYTGTWIQAEGEFIDAGEARRVAISLGPEHGTVGPDAIKEAAKEAMRGAGFDLLVVCGFAFDPHSGETAKEFAPATDGFAVAADERRLGKLRVLLARMNPDLAMGGDLLKKTGAGNPASYDDPVWEQEAGPTIWGVFGEDSAMFGRPDQQWMVNFRVRDLDAMVGQLRAGDVEVEVDPEDYPNGRFAPLADPDGNPIQLWQPR